MSAALHVIDVGHGNCTLVVEGDWALMVDAGASSAVVETVAQLTLSRLDAVVISHRDFDHARGLVPLLSRQELEIGAVYIGADASKNPTAPETANLLAALHDAKRSGRCVVSRDIDAACEPGLLDGPHVRVGVLAPTFEMAMSGPLGTTRSGETITSNAASVVLRVALEDGLRVLLPGDMDDVTLEELVADGTDLSADVLVFPHHGSLGTVSDERKFAATVCQAVKPGKVLFSVGRGSRARPTEEILRGVFDADPAVSVACTQLSSGCLNIDADLASELTHLNGLPAAGRIRCRSCAGSISFAADGAQTPNDARHQGYIDMVAKTPMCRLARPAGP